MRTFITYLANFIASHSFLKLFLWKLNRLRERCFSILISPLCNHIIRRGSFNSQKHWIPLLSDLDYIIGLKFNSTIFRKMILFTGRAFRITDLAFFKPHEIKLLDYWNYADVLFSNGMYDLKTKQLAKTPLFHPVIFIRDLFEKIYNYQQHFTLNLELYRKTNSRYYAVKADLILQKVVAAQKHLSDLANASHMVNKLDHTLIPVTNLKVNIEDITDQFLSAIDELSTTVNPYLDKIRQLVPAPLKAYNLTEDQELLGFHFGGSYKYILKKEVYLKKSRQGEGYLYTPENLFHTYQRLGLLTLDQLGMQIDDSSSSILKCMLIGKERLGKFRDIRHFETDHSQGQFHFFYRNNRDFWFPGLKSTTIVNVSWGRHKERDRAMTQSIRENMKTLTNANFVLLDLVADNDFIDLKQQGQLQHIKLNFSEVSRGLWHKEALFNMGLNLCAFSENLIFMDSDVLIPTDKWLQDFHSKLDKSEKPLFIQGFKSVTDTQVETYYQESWVYHWSLGEQPVQAPGLIWGAKTKDFLSVEGFNIMMPEGSGDGAFVHELTHHTVEVWVRNIKWFNSNLRHLNIDAKLDYLDYNVEHINHGPERDYANRLHILSNVTPSIDAFYDPSPFGLLEWKGRGKYFTGLGFVLENYFSNPHYFLEFMQESYELELFNDSVLTLQTPRDPVAVSFKMPFIAHIDSIEKNKFRLRVTKDQQEAGAIVLKYILTHTVPPKTEVEFSFRCEEFDGSFITFEHNTSPLDPPDHIYSLSNPPLEGTVTMENNTLSASFLRDDTEFSEIWIRMGLPERKYDNKEYVLNLNLKQINC